MTRPVVGLIGPPNAPFLQRLAEALQRRDAEVHTLDLGRFPQGLKVSITSSAIFCDTVPLDRLSAAYFFRAEYMSPVPYAMPSRTTGHDTVRQLQEARSVRVSVHRLVSDCCRLVNPAQAHRAALLLPALLRRLESAGLPVVPFVAGNDLEHIAYFVDEHGQQCRGRRLGQRSFNEKLVDFDDLVHHHLDFDHFPLIVRKVLGGPESHVLVIGGRAVGSVAYQAGEGWAKVSLSPPARDLSCAAAAAAGLELALVHLEQVPGGPPALVALEPEPDLEALERQGSLGATRQLADRLLALAQLPAKTPLSKPPHPAMPQTRASRPLRIGIVGRAGDPETDAMRQALFERGAEPVLLEFFMFPAERSIHECRSDGRIATTDLAELDAVYVRAVGGVPATDLYELSGEEAHALRAEEECWRFCYGVLETLALRIPVINPPLGQEVHRTKTHQIFSLIRAGFPLPLTVVSNDLEACQQFVAAAGGEDQVVVKPLAGIYKTERLAELNLEVLLDSGPVMLQRLVTGDTVRAYFVGGRFIGAARILSSDRAVDASVEPIGVACLTLPDEVTRMGRAAASHLGLAWTGMDFIRDAATGKYWVLECNASPMFVSFSRQTGVDVPGALADLLIQSALGNPVAVP